MYGHSTSNPSLLDQESMLGSPESMKESIKMMFMNLRHRRKANANSTFTHILALIHALYIPALRRPTGIPHTHTHRHTIFRTGGFSISWQLVSLVFTE